MAIELQYIRESKGYSQSELARISGVPQSTISRIEQGKTVARPETRRKIARALEVGIVDIAEFIPKVATGELRATAAA